MEIHNEGMYKQICSYIPDVMQHLYSDHARNSIDLVELRDAFRANQMQGKAWLCDNINHFSRSSKILVVGSWLGFLSYCLYKMGFNYITETDIDSRLEILSCSLNSVNDNFLHYNYDVNDIQLDEYDIIINTSCEHIENNNWFYNIKDGTILVLQSTNFVSHDHPNTVNSIDEMKSKYKLSKYMYEGELVFNSSFSRFMIIGVK